MSSKQGSSSVVVPQSGSQSLEARLAAAASAVAGFFTALAPIGAFFEGIASCNRDAEQFRLETSRVKAWGRVERRKIRAAEHVVLARLAERRQIQRAILEAFRQAMRAGGARTQFIGRALAAVSRCIRETPMATPGWVELIAHHRFLAELLVQESERDSRSIEGLIRSIQDRFPPTLVPDADVRLLDEPGGGTGT